MRTTFKPGHVLATVALLGLGIGTVAWTGNGGQQSNKYYQDTIPSRRKEVRESDRRYRKDLDKELAELDRALQSIENVKEIDTRKIQEDIQAAMEQLRGNLDHQKVDMEKMQLDLQESLRQLNTEKIQEEMHQALKQLKDIDAVKMKADMERALEHVNSDEFKKHLDIAMDKADAEKFREHLHESLRSIDAERIQEEVARARRQLEKVDMEKVRGDMDRAMSQLRSLDVQKLLHESMSKEKMEEIQRNMERAKEQMEQNQDNMKLKMEKARESIRRAKDELRTYQEMLGEMENDGLIDTHEDYKIQFKDNDLFINGEKQSSKVTDKYRKYFKEDTVIEKEGGNMNINRNRNEGPRRCTVSI